MTRPPQILEREVLDELPLGLWVARAPDGLVVMVNRAFRRIMGMEPVETAPIEETPGVYGIMDRHNRPFPVEQLPFTRALVEGQPVVVDDIVIARRDGSRVFVRACGTPLRDPTGVITHVAVSFWDTSLEVAANEGRRQAEQRLAFAVQNAPIVLWMTDAAGVTTLSEGAALTALGLRPGQVVGQSVYELYRDSPEICANHRRAMAGERVSYTAAVGDLHFMSQLAPLRDASGAVTEVIGVATDVSESHRLQQKVVANDRVHAIGTLAASVAHEINNPLTYVLANLELAESELQRAIRCLDGVGHSAAAAALIAVQEATDLLGPVRLGAERVRRITQDLRTFSRGDEDAAATCDLRLAVRRAVDLVGKDLQARARLVLDLADATSEPIRVSGSELRLSQVFVNLLVNAWQALEESDPVRHEIRLRITASPQVATVEIADTGPGVPEADRARIFEPFMTTKPLGAGTGLGLFVCRNIVAAVGGTIQVDERPGGGALFRVTLPVPSPHGAVPVSRHATPHPPVTSAQATPRLLIVDDDDLVAQALAHSARAAGCEAQVVSDGEQALEVLRAGERFDVIYVDLMMRGMSGFDLADRIEECSPELLDRLVLMTGGAFTPEARAYIQTRQPVLLQKPFNIVTDLRTRISGWRSQSRG